MSLNNWFNCGHCGYEGCCYGNGFSSPWCFSCHRGNKLTRIVNPKRFVNGNQHLANMEVLEYDGLKFVTESPQEGSVRLTIYRGDAILPLSTETYGNVAVNTYKEEDWGSPI